MKANFSNIYQTHLTNLVEVINRHKGKCNGVFSFQDVSHQILNDGPSQFSFKLIVNKNHCPQVMPQVQSHIIIEINSRLILNNVGGSSPSGDCLVKDDIEQHRCSWHFDFDKPQDEQGAHRFVHPLSHLTYGGRQMSTVNLGDTLLLTSPRICHPPMDPILLIDFILSNYIPKGHYDNIRIESDYKRALQFSQSSYWRPYYESINKSILNGNTNSFVPTLC